VTPDQGRDKQHLRIKRFFGTSENAVKLSDKMPLQQAFPGVDPASDTVTIDNQLNLFAF